MSPNLKSRQTIEDVEKIVQEYKVGNNPAAAAELLECLKPYCSSFVRLLTQGVADASDKKIRLFLALYIKDKEDRRRFYKEWGTKWGRKVAADRASFLADICKSIEIEEMIHECQVIVLTLAQRYENMNRSFIGYLNTAFRFELHRSLEQMVMDPLVFSARWNVPYSDTEHDPESDDFRQVDEALTYEEGAFSMEYSELGPDWFNGLTCSDEFRNLSPSDRKIIKLYYLDKLSDQRIADRIGLTRSWITKRRLAAVKKIKDST